MTKITRRRATGFSAAIAIVAALLSPLLAVSAASAGDITGTTFAPGSEQWQDKVIDDEFIVGTFYQDSVQAPGGYAPYSFSTWLLPPGLNVTVVPSTGVISITGTPTTASTTETIRAVLSGANNTQFEIEFNNIVVSAVKTPTTVSVSGAALQPYSAVSFTAQVSNPTATGTVQFTLGSTVVGSAPVVAGDAVFAGSAPSSLIGTTQVLTAVYSGDSTYATSTSTTTDVVTIYGNRTLSGTVTQNGGAVANEPIQLLDPAGAPSGFSAMTDVNGNFSIDLGTPTTAAQATANYKLYAQNLGVYFATGAGMGSPNVTTVAAATTLYPWSWGVALNIYSNVAPVWSDNVLGQPRIGEPYSDYVAATTEFGIAPFFSVASGSMPSWLTLDNTTGEVQGANPSDQNTYTFEVRATNNYGSVLQAFTMTALDAGVAPTFTDTTLATPVIGAVYTDGVAASGDPSIVYTSTALPAGLVLNPTTGAVTGTPTASGPFTVTFTATNDYGFDDYGWQPTIAVAPMLGVVPGFESGDDVETATTEISAAGLQVGSAYTFTMYSTPRVLYSGTVDASGAFLHTVTLPADTPVGAHELILTGIAPDGTVLSAHAWFTVLPNGRIGAISLAGPIPFLLAATGSEPLLPLGIASALLLAGFLGMRRSRGVRVP